MIREENMFGNFEEDARKILVLAKEEMHDLKHPYVAFPYRPAVPV